MLSTLSITGFPLRWLMLPLRLDETTLTLSSKAQWVSLLSESSTRQSMWSSHHLSDCWARYRSKVPFLSRIIAAEDRYDIYGKWMEWVLTIFTIHLIRNRIHDWKIWYALFDAPAIPLISQCPSLTDNRYANQIAIIDYSDWIAKRVQSRTREDHFATLHRVWDSLRRYNDESPFIWRNWRATIVGARPNPWP